MDKRKITLCAALLARSNMGQPPLPDATLAQMHRIPMRSLDNALEWTIGSLVETDEQFEMFKDEATGFVDMLNVMSDEDLVKQWPHIAEMYAKATAEVEEYL